MNYVRLGVLTGASLLTVQQYMGVFLIIDALVLLAIYLTGILSRIFAAIPGPVSFPLHVMAPPFRSSSCRLLSVEGSAAGDRSRTAVGKVGQVRAKRATHYGKLFQKACGRDGLW